MPLTRIRFADIGPISDQVWAGEKDLAFQSIEFHPFLVEQNRVPHGRIGMDLPDPDRDRQKQNDISSDPEYKSENRDLSKTDIADLKQIFIRSTEGKHICVQIWERMSIWELKNEIQDRLGIPVTLQILIFSGVCMQGQHTLQYYKVAKDSTIILNHRLRGGSKGSTSKPTGSYRDAAKGKEHSAVNTPPGQYIVDEVPESPSIPLDIPEVQGIFSDLQKKQLFVDLTVSGLKRMLCTNGSTRSGHQIARSIYA